MRIVITNNGTKIIEDLSPDNSVDYSPDSNRFNTSKMNRTRNKHSKKNKSINNAFQKTKRFYSQNSSNIFSKENYIDINDLLKNLTNKQYKTEINKNFINNIKIINLKNKKKVKLPKPLEDKYLIYDKFNTENKKKYIPKILLSINDSIDNDLLHKKNMKSIKTFSEITLNDTERNNKEDSTLPTIRQAFPLKYIIGKDSVKRLNKEMTLYEKSCDLEKKLFPKNYFINKNWEQSKKNVDISLNNEIDSKNINLIEYLNKNKNISNVFLQQFSKLNNEKIDKLDHLSKKILYRKEQDKKMSKTIKEKIKTNLMNININFRKSLDNMNNKLNKYDYIIKRNKEKFLSNEKNNNRYLEQFMEAEKNWDKYNLLRFYKKSSSPKRSAYTSFVG
jgi:hypothetical protein